MATVQEDLYAGAPESKGLLGVKEMKVEAITVGKHHNMRSPPDMRHCTVIIFHFTHLSWVDIRWKYFIQEMAILCDYDQ